MVIALSLNEAGKLLKTWLGQQLTKRVQEILKSSSDEHATLCRNDEVGTGLFYSAVCKWR